jgi:hypothetical protein
VKNIKYIFGIALLIAIFLLGRSCNHTKETYTSFNTSDLRLKEAQIKDLKPIIEYREKEVVKWRTKWREGKHDTIPCDSAIVILKNVCDTIILKDSLLIQIQADVITKQDSIIQGWHTAHTADSVTIMGLNREVKRQKRQKWLIGICGGVLVGSLLVR